MIKKYEDVNEHRSKLYCVWVAMRQRCDNPNNRDYKYYGAKGVKVCEEWYDYLSFKDWATKSGYSDGLTIDRVNTYGDYSPDNCRWITIVEQQQNKSNSRLITYKGETHNLTEWSKITGISREALKHRLNCGTWSIEEILTTPVIKDNKVKQSYKKRKSS